MRGTLKRQVEDSRFPAVRREPCCFDRRATCVWWEGGEALMENAVAWIMENGNPHIIPPCIAGMAAWLFHPGAASDKAASERCPSTSQWQWQRVELLTLPLAGSAVRPNWVCARHQLNVQ